MMTAGIANSSAISNHADGARDGRNGSDAGDDRL
jgi:hypothetical protein